MNNINWSRYWLATAGGVALIVALICLLGTSQSQLIALLALLVAIALFTAAGRGGNLDGQ